MTEVEYRVPPQSIEIEESVLAGCLLFKEPREAALDLIRPSDFYRNAHQTIFQTIQDLHSRKKPVDLHTLVEALRGANNLEQVGGATYISTLIDEAPMAVSMEHYCGIIRKKAVAREMIAACHDTINNCFEANDHTISEVIDQSQTRILEIGIDIDKIKFLTMEDMTHSAMERYEELNAGIRKEGVKTGFQGIDLCTGGFNGSKLVIIAARPRIGKTALMTNMAKNIALGGQMVGVFSIEMDADDIFDRFMAAETGINSMRLGMGTGPSGSDWEKIVDVQETISHYQIILDDTGGLTVQELKRRARLMKKAGVDIIFIDQLSKIKGDRRKSKFEEATSIVEQLADLKKELRMPVVLLAQINRRAEDRDNKKPTLADLKNTGQIEEDADIVLIGHRPYEYTKLEEQKHDATWEIAKNRGGPCKNVPMAWYPKITTFVDRQEI